MYSNKHAKFGPYAQKPIVGTVFVPFKFPATTVVSQLYDAYMAELGMVSSYPADKNGAVYSLNFDTLCWCKTNFWVDGPQDDVLRDATKEEVKMIVAFNMLHATFAQFEANKPQ